MNGNWEEDDQCNHPTCMKIIDTGDFLKNKRERDSTRTYIRPKKYHWKSFGYRHRADWKKEDDTGFYGLTDKDDWGSPINT